MRKLLLLAVLSIVAVTPARADDILLGEPQLVAHSSIESPTVFDIAALVPSYSNVDNFLGAAYANGSATSVSGILTTAYVADDINLDPGYVGQPIVRFYFSVANLGASNVSARARVRFHLPDGAGGNPGSYITGYTFSAISFPPGVSLFYADIAALNLPGQFWAGMTFDNSGTGATATQLNQLGQGIFSPPTVGTTADIAFRTSAASIGNVNNPPGSSFNFGGQPPANFGWAFNFDQVTPAENSSWGRIKAQYHD